MPALPPHGYTLEFISVMPFASCPFIHVWHTLVFMYALCMLYSSEFSLFTFTAARRITFHTLDELSRTLEHGRGSLPWRRLKTLAFVWTSYLVIVLDGIAFLGRSNGFGFISPQTISTDSLWYFADLEMGYRIGRCYSSRWAVCDISAILHMNLSFSMPIRLADERQGIWYVLQLIHKQEHR